MPVHLRRYYLPCSEWWLPAGRCVPFVACPFDRHEFQSPRVIESQHSPKLAHGSAFSSFWVSPRVRLVAIRTTYSLSDLISRFPSWIFIAAMTANSSARLLVCSRPGKVKEQFLSSLVLKNTPKPAPLILESLVADARSVGPGNDTVVILGFPFESRA